MKFITITPIWYDSDLGKYKESDSKITLNIDSIEQVYHPNPKHKLPFYTIWIKGKGHEDTVKTFDPITDSLRQMQGVNYYEYRKNIKG